MGQQTLKCITKWQGLCTETSVSSTGWKLGLGVRVWVRPLKVIENNRTKILRDFKFQTDKQVLVEPSRHSGG